jgi:hypothetical protein
MVKKLADLWGVPIRVGINLQPITKLDIEPPVFTAFPNSYNLQSWSRQFQDLDLQGLSHA